MESVIISDGYEIASPRSICKRLKLQPGSKLSVIQRGNCIELVPVMSIESARGMLAGANPEGFREGSAD